MRLDERRAIEHDLRMWYRAQREEYMRDAHAWSDDGKDACIKACEAELEALSRLRAPRVSGCVFVARQLRFVNLGTWVALTVLAMAAAWGGVIGSGARDVAAPMLPTLSGALLALVFLSNATRSKAFGMAEIEASCRFNAVAVACARMLVVGVACVAVLVVGTCVSSLDGGRAAARTLMWMATPYALACAGGLMCARRAASVNAQVAAFVWAGSVTAGSAMLVACVPGAFAAAAEGLWMAACLACALWCAVEMRAWIRSVAEGCADSYAFAW